MVYLMMLSVSQFMSNSRMVSEQRVGKNVKGSGHGLI
jgi:hypothetical protein